MTYKIHDDIMKPIQDGLYNPMRKGEIKMVNTAKLKGKIVESGHNFTTFADNIKMSRPAFRNKLNGRTDFKAGEIERICITANISQADMLTIFFPNIQSKMD